MGAALFIFLSERAGERQLDTGGSQCIYGSWRGYDWYAAWWWPGLDWTECQHPHPTAEAGAGGGGLVAGWLSPHRGVGPGHQPAPCTSPCLHTAMTKGECVWATHVRHDSRYIFMFVIMFVSSTQWCMYINAGRCSPGLCGEQWWW